MNTEYPKYRWFVLLTMVIATLAQGSLLISFAPLIPTVSEQMGLSLGQTTGALMGAFTLFVSIFAIVGGAIIDKIGLAKTYIGACLLMILGNTLVPLLGDNFGALVALRLIQGVGCGPVIGSVAAVAVTWFPVKERSIIAGAQGAALTLGTALGLIIVPAIYQSTGDWKVAVAWLSVLSVLALVLAITMNFGPKTPEVASEEQSGNEFALALKQPVTYIGIGCTFLLSWVMQAFNDLTPGYFAVKPPVGVGYGPVIAGQYMTLVQIGFMLGGIASGFVLEKLFARKVKPLVMLAFVLTAIFCFSVKFPFVFGTPSVTMPALFLAGFFMSYVMPACQAFVAMHYPFHIAGKVGGMWMGLGVFGGTVGVLVGSTLLHFTGAYQMSINVVAIVALVGLVVAWFLNPPTVFAKTS
jgi:MFS family permease